MKKINKYFFFSFICMSLCLTLNAQVEETDNNDTASANDTTMSIDSNNATEDYAPDDEEKIVDVQGEDNDALVEKINNIFSTIQSLEQQDTIFSYYAIYETSPQIVEYFDNKNSLKGIVTKFDVAKIKDDNENNYTFIKETVFNENQAWDYIYERLYDKDNKLVYFVRRYNTFNSGCAEVAFEKSDYYYNSNGDLIKKTYEIYDSNNNILHSQNCFMERESYDKYMTLGDFLSEHQLPIQ
jgi:hypothetical protein